MCGVIGYDPDKFGLLTPRETSIIYNAYTEQQTVIEQQHWERTRFQTAMLINVHLKAKDQKPPQQLFPFPWDKKDKPQTEPSTRERYEYLKKKWK